MASADDYRNNARDCIKSAKQAIDPTFRETMLESAKLWMDAAIELELSNALDDDAPPLTAKHKA